MPERTKKKLPTVKEVVAAIDDAAMRKDVRTLIAMMRRISGKGPKIWNVATIGFDSYRYAYGSGREGECHIIAFYARKGMITVYLMDGTARYAGPLSQLGTHTASRVCLYIKRLSDVRLPVLERIVKQSYRYIKSRDGHMHRAMA